VVDVLAMAVERYGDAARGVQDADERVLHQLLDFAHRTSLLHPLAGIYKC
jgi:hypothetical protein